MTVSVNRKYDRVDSLCGMQIEILYCRIRVEEILLIFIRWRSPDTLQMRQMRQLQLHYVITFRDGFNYFFFTENRILEDHSRWVHMIIDDRRVT